MQKQAQQETKLQPPDRVPTMGLSNATLQQRLTAVRLFLIFSLKRENEQIIKESDRGLWLQTRDGLLKLLQEISLSDEERAAVEGDVQALSRLLERLSDVPTPGECQKRDLPVIPVSSIFPAQQLAARSSGKGQS